MKKSYIFNGEEYFDLNSLALAYQDNFETGMDDIFSNSKRLIKFVKVCRQKNKEFLDEIISILYSSKYKNSALTFIIFSFSNENIVVINGKKLSFDEFILCLKNSHSNPNDSALYGFLEDHGLSRTYARLDANNPIFKDVYYIERNCYNKFAIDYLTTYNDFELKESLNGKISSIAINAEECFRRGTKATRSEMFQLAIAHKVGFKEAIEMNMDVNPIFKAVKLLNNMKECEEDLLRKLIGDTFYWWLLDNFDKYLIVKKKAKKVFLNLIELKKEYKKYQDMIAQKKIYSISLELFTDLSRSLYINYLEFAELFHDGAIIVKNKIQDKERYNLNKPYCKTFICQDFMNGNVIKLQSEASDDLTVKINPLTGEEIALEDNKENNEFNEAILDNSSLKIDNLSDDVLTIRNKKNKKMNRLSSFTIFVNVVIIVLLTISICLSFFMQNNENQIFDNLRLILNDSILVYILGYAASVVGIIFAIILRCKVSHRLNSIYDLIFINAFNDYNVCSYEGEVKYNLLVNDIDLMKSKVNKSNRIVSSGLLAIYSIAITSMTIVIMAIAASFISQIDLSNVIGNFKIYIAYLINFGVTLIFGLVKKYKGVLSNILISLISIITVLILFVI
ncbi:MAG: hypothetical protein ACI35S_09260 [Anaeroplasma sp.]